MADQPTPIALNPDGSVTRAQMPTVPPSPDPNSPSAALSRDVPLNPSLSTWVRLFLPRTRQEGTGKLPLIVYYHGGGFVRCSAANVIFHNFCAEMAAQVGAVVVSVEYRLAPEHRLPAAYDDAVEALHWIASCGDEWLRDFADLSCCFLAGTSAGGNIAYHAGITVAADPGNILPVKIRGLVLHQPYFGGSERTPSEVRSVDDGVLPLSLNDLMWSLSLPEGVDRDHEYANPTAKARLEDADRMRQLEWKVMITGCEKDPLIDREMELARVLEEKGVPLITQIDEGGYHGAQLLEAPMVKAFFNNLKRFAWEAKL